MPVYASVHKERSRVYSEPHLDLSLPSTPLDADQSQQQHLQPLGSIYEAPDLLTAAEGPRVLAWKDIEEVSPFVTGYTPHPPLRAEFC